ncbi:MAG TPA: BrnT family toxin [Paraburkholderia sp.]|jgi:uncharacterized DUF497 family protein|nr:BrnT family toxin [Paraburkholderia sp.]
MDVIYDPAKRQTNLHKHGVDFVDIDEVLFSDPYALMCEDEDHDEQRFVVIAMDGFGNVLVVVYTYPDDTTIRLISARRADPQERQQYEDSDERSLRLLRGEARSRDRDTGENAHHHNA